MARVVVVGSYGVGLTMTMARAPEAGETVQGRTFVTAHGGKGSNQAIGAARLGADVALCTVIGDDEHGRAARRLWDDERVDASLVHSVADPSMVGFILVEDGGENRIVIAPGALGRFAPAHLDGLPAALRGADVLLVGLEIPVATAWEALRHGRAAGVTTVLNPAPAPTAPLPAALLELVDHLTPNRTEAVALAGLPASATPDQIVAAPGFAGVPHVALTLGADGVLVRTRGELHRVPAQPVVAVDTTGAGDAFNAAYAVRLAEGADPITAARFAVRAGAHCVQIAEVVPSLPYLDDLDTQSTTATAGATT